MSDTPEHLREKRLYDAIADPDCTAWECPTCGYSNYHAYGMKECARCGYELDHDRVSAALTERSAFPKETVASIKERKYECFIEDHEPIPWTPGRCAGYAGRGVHLMRCKRHDGYGLGGLFCQQHGKDCQS
jgi:hypothetical protein